MVNLPADQQLQQINLQRQQALADALRQQSMQNTPNEVIGGRVVPQGWGGALAKIAQGYMGGKMQGDIDHKQTAMVDALRGKRTDWINAMPKATQQMGTDGMGPPQTIQPTPEQNMQWALQGGEIDPALMSAGMGMMNQNENRAQREDLANQASADRLGTQQAAQQAAAQLQAERLAAQAEMKRHHDEILRAMKSQGGGGNPYFTPVQTANGVFAFDARKGALTPLNVGGAPVIGSASDPSLQGQIAQAKAGGTETGKTTAEAKMNLPQTIATAEQSIKQIDDLIKHPAFESSVGMTMLPGARFIEGTPQADFTARLDQLKGGAFLQAFQSLKGGGQITEVEGKKATDAITRMNKSQSESEFKTAAKEYQDIVKAGIQRAKTKAGNPGRRASDQGADDPLGLR